MELTTLIIIALIYSIIASYPLFWKGLVEISKQILLLITYIIAGTIKVWKWIKNLILNK